MGDPGDGGDAAGDDFGGLSPRLGGHGRAARGRHDSRARKRSGNDRPNGLEELNPEFFPVDVQFHDDSFGVDVLLVDSLSLKTAVDFNAESQRCRVMQRKSEVLRGNGKYKNFSDRVNLHQLGVACMVLQK